MSRQFFLRTVAVLVLALVYSIGVFSRSVWYDESITIYTISTGVDYLTPFGLVPISEIQSFLSNTGSPASVVERLIVEDVHPPLYFVTLNIWAFLFGTSIEAARMYSVVTTLAAVGIFHRWVHVQRPELAYWLTAVFALSGLVIAVSTDARSTALVVLLAVSALHLSTTRNADGAVKTDLRTEIWLGVAAAALLLTHYFAAFIVVPIMFYRGLLLLSTRNKMFLLSPAIGFLLFLPWFPVFLDHLGARSEQGNGFEGLFAWAKVLVWRTGQLILAPSHWQYPNLIAKLGQLGVVFFAAIGAIATTRSLLKSPAKWSIEAIVFFVMFVGLVLMTSLFALTDKMMSPLRYFAVFLPSVVILLLCGINTLAQVFTNRLGVGNWQTGASVLGFATLIAVQGSMINLGYESNAQASGNYLKSMAEDMSDRPSNESLIVVDAAVGRGDTLNVAVALPGAIDAFVLSPKSTEWRSQLNDFKTVIDGRKDVWINYSITRGVMGEDKSGLYSDFVEILEAEGFSRRDLGRSNRTLFHAVWTKTD